MIKSIDSLDPKLQSIATAFLAKLKELDISVQIGETRRLLSVQMAYYSRSRMSVENVKAMFKAAGLWQITDEEAKIASTQTLDSYHIKGLAFDIIPQKNGKDYWEADKETWQTIGNIGKSFGLVWGGDFGKTLTKLGWDCPHFELHI
jgi:hypothetical protein